VLSPLIAVYQESATTSWITVAGAVMAMLLVGVARGKICGTTLVGPWWWALAALTALAIVEALIALGALRENLPAWRLMAAVGIFSPWMSLLGAKRPQDQAWHFIVASLWGIQAMPAAESLLLRPGQPMAIIDFRAYFLLVLIGLSLLVYLPTRRWPSALIAAAAQVALMWQFLPWAKNVPCDGLINLGAWLLTATLAVEWIRSRRVKHFLPFDSLWLDFRDAFGALWGARVMERINAAAVLYQWPERLTWSGWVLAEDPTTKAVISPKRAAEIRPVVESLARRFVSAAWIDERLG
jgi:hypothetical protein